MRKPEATARMRESSSWITFWLGLLTQDAEFETNNKEMGEEKKGREKKKRRRKEKRTSKEGRGEAFLYMAAFNRLSKRSKGKILQHLIQTKEEDLFL